MADLDAARLYTQPCGEVAAHTSVCRSGSPGTERSGYVPKSTQLVSCSSRCVSVSHRVFHRVPASLTCIPSTALGVVTGIVVTGSVLDTAGC